MRVKITVLAQGAYASIKTSAISMDVLLPAGKGAPAGLRERAQAMRNEANSKLKRAALMEEAANKLEEDAAAGRITYG